MLDIILVVTIIVAVGGAYIYRSRMKQQLLDELSGSYIEGANLVKSCTGDKLPAELKKTLHHPLRELAVTLRTLEESFSSELAIFRMKQILKEDKPQVEAKCREIKAICTNWNNYANFKQNLAEGLSDAYSRSNDITDRILAVTRFDKSYQDTVQIRAAAVLNQLEEYQAKCKELSSLTFAEFTPEHKAPTLPEAFLQEADLLSRELQYFNRSLKAVITGIYRKSIYYLNLEDSSEKSTRRSAGTVQVSYKTFRDVKKGDSYKWEIIIGGKHTSGEQNITFKTFKGEQQTTVTLRVDKNQFEEIFKALKFNRKFEETDDNGIPYQINALDLNVTVCEKKAFDFDVVYELPIFKNTSIYDFLSYTSSALELAGENDNPALPSLDEPQPTPEPVPVLDTEPQNTSVS